MQAQMLLFDLDGTLLRSDKTISPNALQALRRYRQAGLLIGIATSRGEQNALSFVDTLQPDVVISSAGALVRHRGRVILQDGFTALETGQIIECIRSICGGDVQLTVDTVEKHYWNYRVDPLLLDATWGDTIYSDFSTFRQDSLKICFETAAPHKAHQIADALPHCDCIRFSGGNWHKLTSRTATKENAILWLCDHLGLTTDCITAFGDDYADIGMLRLCGIGVAMGNAIQPVKEAADLVIGSNDEDGIALYLEALMDGWETRATNQ